MDEHEKSERPMVEVRTAGMAPLTEDAFLADRMTFWSSFTGLLTGATAGVAVLMVLLAIFLL